MTTFPRGSHAHAMGSTEAINEQLSSKACMIADDIQHQQDTHCVVEIIALCPLHITLKRVKN